MKITQILKFVVWLSLKGVVTGICQIPFKKQYTIPKTTIPPVIDGSLNDDVWGNAPWTEEFTSLLDSLSGIMPSTNMKTRAKVEMLWDDRNIYVGAQMIDPLLYVNVSNPSDIELFDNTFEMFVDLDRTNHQYKRIQMNPMGIHRTLEYAKPPADGGLVNSWDTSSKITFGVFNSTPISIFYDTLSFLDSITEVSGQWTVEWAIPINLLRKTKKRGDPSMNSFANFQFMRAGWPPSTLPAPPPENPSVFDKRKLLSILEPITESSPFQHVWSNTPGQSINPIENPEYWGTVEFSELTKISPEHRKKPDPQRLARYVLMEVYHAERDFFATHGLYTSNLRELHTRNHHITSCGKIPKITLSKDRSRYVASVRLGENVGRVREDRYLWFSKK